MSFDWAQDGEPVEPFRASACPGATAFAPERYYGETTKKLSESLIIRNPGLGQGIPVYPGWESTIDLVCAVLCLTGIPDKP